MGRGELPARAEGAPAAEVLRGQGRPPARAGLSVARGQLPVALVAAQERGAGGRRRGAGRRPPRSPPPAADATRRRPRRPSPRPLPPVESLTPESDFTPFMKPEVDGETRREALKTLFDDPRFNVMDGMDVYVDDYSKPDPDPRLLAGQARADFAPGRPGRPRPRGGRAAAGAGRSEAGGEPGPGRRRPPLRRIPPRLPRRSPPRSGPGGSGSRWPQFPHAPRGNPGLEVNGAASQVVYTCGHI